MTELENKARPNYPIESVDNALRLLLMLRERTSLRVAEASDAIGVARSTAHRLLAMLQWHGLIQQDPRTKAYHAGPILVELGVSVLGQLDVRTQARPILEDLHQQFDETVHLVLPRGQDVLFLSAIESTRHLRVAERTGARLPAHCTSVGKAILAALPDENVTALYPHEELPAGLTPASLTTRSQLLEEIRLIRKRGYASNFGESEVDVGSVGAAIVRNEEPVAAISLAVPISRFSDDRRTELGDAAMSAAAQIATRLRL